MMYFKKFLKIFSLLSIFILSFFYSGPEKYKREVSLFINFCLSEEMIIEDEDFKKAKNNVITKVYCSKNIKNKKFIINQIENSIVRKHTNNNFLLNDLTMSYVYHGRKQQDYIFVNTDEIQIMDLNYVHELNHLVDNHKIDDKEIDIKSFLKQDFTKSDYIEYFKDWPKYIDTATNDTTEILGTLLYQQMSESKEYYLNEDEIYARLSSMKAFFLNRGYISNTEEEVNEEIINVFRENFYQIYCKQKNSELIIFTTLIDFIVYLPIINWDKSEEINLVI